MIYSGDLSNHSGFRFQTSVISDPDPDLIRIQSNLFYPIQNPGLDIKRQNYQKTIFFVHGVTSFLPERDLWRLLLKLGNPFTKA
jgi:hypothetical protein